MNVHVPLAAVCLPADIKAQLNQRRYFQGFQSTVPLYWPRHRVVLYAPSYLKQDSRCKFRRMLKPVRHWTDADGNPLNAKQTSALDADLREGLGLDESPYEYLAYRATAALLLPLLPPDVWQPGLRLKGSEIHHEDGNSLDDRLENLTIMDRASHARAHQERGEIYEPLAGQELAETAAVMEIVERFVARVAHGYHLSKQGLPVPVNPRETVTMGDQVILEFLDDLDPALGWDFNQFLFILAGEPEWCRSYGLPEGLAGIRTEQIQAWVGAGDPVPELAGTA
uniref:HNH nuclease domain-containing protein n=1 Tax=Cyanothece sp. (strain PCC 7425 / ATCC 29141) TaxID=395961 RepID=B8HWK0_CYAP4